MNTHFRGRDSYVKISRSTALAGLVGGAAALATRPFAARAKEQSSLERFTLIDNHASPLARKSDVIVYDTADRALADGTIFMTLTDTHKKLYVARAVTDGFDIWWIERFERGDRFGPMSAEFLQARILGRVVAMFTHIDKGGSL